MKILARLLAAGALTAAALAFSSSAMAVEHVLKFHTFVGEESAVWRQMLRPWMNRIERESEGRIRFEAHAGMSLGGKPPELIEQIKRGVVDVAWTMPAFSKNRYQRLEAFELPFMLTNAEAVSRAYWEYVQTYAADAFKEVQPLALHVSGPNVIHTRHHAVRNIDQIKDLRVSAVTRQTGNLLDALGAKPVGVQQGTPTLSEQGLDAVLAPWETVPTSRLQRQARFHTELRTPTGVLSTNAYVLAINKATYQKMPAELRKIIDNNAGLETSAWLGRMHQQSDQAGREAVPDGTVITLTTQDASKFRQAAAQVEQQWVKLVTAQGFNGQKLLDGAKTLIRKHTK